MSIQGTNGWMSVFDDEANDPMNTRNHVVKRAFINDAVLCSVVLSDGVKHLEELKRFDAAEYSRQAFKKFGKCRVFFYKPGVDKVWREIRWKNANVGTLYKRPSFMTVGSDDVPAELVVAMLCAG